MAEIISIGTSLPPYRHNQSDIVEFMQEAYALDEIEKRKLAFVYARSAIKFRYSVVEDFSLPRNEWRFWPKEGNVFPTLDARMEMYKREALPLSVKAVNACIEGYISTKEITHLITVSCTGMSAPGLDLEILEEMNLAPDIFRTSVNFMGCYAAVHALRIGKMICDTDKNANVIIVSTELCTLHFQEQYTSDNVSSGLLFSDGCAAVLLSNNNYTKSSLKLTNFYSSVATKGKQDMAWEISSKGFLMTLSGYIPNLVEEDIEGLLDLALEKSGTKKNEITHWCIHPGGRKILDAIQKKLNLSDEDIKLSRESLFNYGNLSSANILFVLKEILDNLKKGDKIKIFGVAFGPGLTMETLVATSE